MLYKKTKADKRFKEFTKFEGSTKLRLTKKTF